MHKFCFKACTLLSGIGVFLLTGCSGKLENDSSADKIATVRFRIDVPSFQVYTKSLNHENGTTADKFAFYQFGENDIYERTYVTDYSAMGLDGTTLTYSLVTGKYSGHKKYVIVRATDGEILPKLNLGDTMKDILEAKTPDSNGGLASPGIMSSMSADGNAWIDIDNIAVAGCMAESLLPRRVARVDILNNPEETGLEIDDIFVRNAMSTVFIANTPGATGDVCADVQKISSRELVGGKSFYLYPTTLTADTEHASMTSIWATTRLVGKNEVGPEVRLSLAENMDIKANYIYELTVNKVSGGEGGGFELTERNWSDGSPSDWIPAGNCIVTQNDKAEIIEATQIKGTYVKVPWNSFPYKITKTVIDNKAEDFIMTSDSDFPTWLKITSTTTNVGDNMYRHDVVYVVNSPKPGDNTRYAITYPEGCTDDKEILSIGFIDPYPGTPLPCLSWGSNFYSPVHVGQTGYLSVNRSDKAYYAGKTAYTIDDKDIPFKNDEKAEPCPEGWRTLTDSEAEDLLKWIGSNLRSKEAEGVYTYNLFGNPLESTNIRIQGGYARTVGPERKDIACYGTWPNVAWIHIDDVNLKYTGGTFGSEWSITEGYGIPYRCIRSKEGWN